MFVFRRKARWRELVAQRAQHEARLQELAQRRKRLQWARKQHEQGLQLHLQQQRVELDEELRRLDQLGVARRAEHQQRMVELRRAEQSPEPQRAQSGDSGEFTHAWDSIEMWEHLMASPESDKIIAREAIENKENIRPHVQLPLKKRSGYQLRKKRFEEALLALQTREDAETLSAEPDWSRFLRAQHAWRSAEAAEKARAL